MKQSYIIMGLSIYEIGDFGKKYEKLDLRVCWVKGHAESKYNKRCDFVACAEATLGAMAY